MNGQKSLTEEWPPEPSPAARQRLEEWANTPLMVIPDYTQFEARKAALEAACALGIEPEHHELFWANVSAFEGYLKGGTKP
jgi:hypothetical protein